MIRLIPVIFALCISVSLLGQEKTKFRKLQYTDFKNEFGFNDTTLSVMDIYFDKRENAAYGQMSFLPITAGLAIIPQTRIIGIATSAVSLPIFIHGCYILTKFSKRNLHKKLSSYTKDKKLPKWLQKKVDKQLAMYKEMEREY